MEYALKLKQKYHSGIPAWSDDAMPDIEAIPRLDRSGSMMRVSGWEVATTKSTLR